MAKKFYLFIILLFSVTAVFAQNGSIKGKVYDQSTNTSLAGANVTIDGSAKQTTTDVNGSFQFNDLTPGDYKIKVKFIGYSDYEKEVDVVAGKVKVLNIPISSQANDLSEVSVFGSVGKESDAAS